MPRTPRGYDGPLPTGRHLRDLLPNLLRGIGKRIEEQPEAVMEAWPQVVGATLAPMTQAVSFTDGLLFVKVSDSTLHSLLTQHERRRLVKSLRTRFPKTNIKNIVFRIG